MTKTRSLAGVALIASVLLLAGCESSTIERGIVTGGEYHAAWTQFVQMCSGTPMHCTQIPIIHPETWTLQLDDGDRKGQRDVEEDAYNRCLIGEMWPDCGQP